MEDRSIRSIRSITCSKCEELKPWTAEFFYPGNRRCIECAKTASRQWYEDNKRRGKESRRLYRESHLEEESLNAKRYYAANSETIKTRTNARRLADPRGDKARKRDYYQENIDRLKVKAKLRHEQNRARDNERARRYYTENKVVHMQRTRAWDKAHPEVGRAKFHRRNARKKGNGGTFTASEWNEILKRCGYVCLACGTLERITIDHVIALKNGGRNDILNLQPLCLSCNSSKGEKSADYRPRAVKQWLRGLSSKEKAVA